jgi:hypothetical protein
VGDDELPGAPGRHGCPRWPRRTRAEAATLPPPGIGAPNDADVAEFRRAQYRLWSGLRDQGNPWLITDFISVGTPMYFAHLLYTRDVKSFDERVKRRELPTCPPQNEERPPDEVSSTGAYFSYPWRGRQVLYDGAPFAVVRWTNLWFPWVPKSFGFLGDWFGGPLRPLFGNGILDVPVRGNLPKRLIPGYAHALYFKFPEDRTDDSVTKHLHEALELGVEQAPTRRQVTFALDLLDELDYPTTALSDAHAALIDPRLPVPSGTVESWLRSMTRPEVSGLDDLLARREARTHQAGGTEKRVSGE